MVSCTPTKHGIYVECQRHGFTAGLVAQYFDERNPAVMKGLETLIKAAKAKGKCPTGSGLKGD